MTRTIGDIVGVPNAGGDFDGVPVTEQGTHYITNDHLTKDAAGSRQAVYGQTFWKLETIESKANKFQNITIKGQFPLEKVKVKMDNTVPSTGSYGQQAPLIQWIKGELKVVTFDVVLFSRDFLENIDVKFKEFQQVLLKNKDLNRPPICRFTYGNALSLPCVVRGFGDVEYDRLKEDKNSRQIKFSITLAAYKDYKIKEIDRNKPPHYSKHTLLAGEDRMWEKIAAKEYGPENALYGDILRKLNKSMAFAAETEVLVTIPTDYLVLNEDIRPEFHGFNKGNEFATENIINKIVERKGKVRVQ